MLLEKAHHAIAGCVASFKFILQDELFVYRRLNFRKCENSLHP